MKRKCPYGGLKVPIGKRVCKRKPGRRAGVKHRNSPAGTVDPQWRNVSQHPPEINDLFHARPTRVVDHRLFWDDGDHMDLPL